MGGVARAALSSGAVIIDSGVGSCVEKFCIRKGLKLVGICPDAQISYPKLSELHRKPNELTNGHTELMIIGKEDGKFTFEWGQESGFKYDFAKRVTQGRPKALGSVSFPQQRIVTVVMGDNEQSAIRDIETSLNLQIPIVIVEGSTFSNELVAKLKNNPKSNKDGDSVTQQATRDKVIDRLLIAAAKRKVIPSANCSEELACVIRLLLTISI